MIVIRWLQLFLKPSLFLLGLKRKENSLPSNSATKQTLRRVQLAVSLCGSLCENIRVVVYGVKTVTSRGQTSHKTVMKEVR